MQNIRAEFNTSQNVTNRRNYVMKSDLNFLQEIFTVDFTQIQAKKITRA